MSSIKLKHASGNSMSIAAPATNPASDLSLKLPATVGTAGQVLRNSSTPGTLEFGPALTQVDQWQVTADFSHDLTAITSNWSRTDTVASGAYQAHGRIGTGMSESSGIFTFPSTGIWRIDFTASLQEAGGAVRYASGLIYATKDNSTYEPGIAAAYISTSGTSSNNYGVSMTSMIMDVENTSTHKVKFVVYAAQTVLWMGDSSNGQPYTYAIFTRLGDT